MTRAEQAFVKRLDARRGNLLTALQIIGLWLTSPWCAASAEEMCAKIAEFVTRKVEEEKAAQQKEAARQGGAKA